MKKILAILLCATALHAQDHLKNFRNKTAKQIANVSHLLRMDTTFFHVRIGEKFRDIAAAREALGLTPRDFATIRAALDTSIFRNNRLIFPPGTFSIDSMGIASPVRISGVGVKRFKPVDTSYYGSIIQATNTDGTLPTITAKESGVWLEWLTFKGTTGRTNGHGFLGTRKSVGGIIRTTLGGYGVANSNAIFNGGDGFHFRGGDGLYLPNLDAYGNKGYGITFIGPGADGQPTAGATADGTTNLLLSGRTRANSKGGISINNNAATIMIGNQSVHDTTWNVYIDGKNRTTIINGDYEFAIPPLDTAIHSYFSPNVVEPVVANMYMNKTRSLTMIGTFLGSDAVEATYTADDLADSSYSTGTGTDATHIVSSQLIANVDDYYVEWEVKNTTLGGSYVAVTDFVASTNTLTLASSIVGQTTGQSFSIRRTPDYAILVDSLESAVFINNALCSNCDDGKKIGVTSYANAIFIGADQNFDVLEDIDAINGADVNVVSHKLDRITTGGDYQVYGTTLYDFFTQDSFLLRSSSGMRQNATGMLDLQYDSEQSVRTFFNVGDSLNRDFRIYGDADSDDDLNKKYFAFGWNASADNQFDIKNETGVDSVYVSFNSIVKFGGAASTERYTAYVNRTAGTKPTASNGEVTLYARGDTLYARDDNNVERSLYAAAGASGDITDVFAGDGLSGGGTTGSVSLAFNPKLVSQTLEITSDSVRVKASSIGANELASTAVTPGSYTATNLTVDADGRITAASNGAGGSGISTPTARANTGWTSDQTTAQDTLATRYYLDAPAMRFAVKGSDNDSLIVHPIANRMLSVKIDGTTEVASIDTSGLLNALTITENSNAVPNATDHLGFFAATTSAQIAGVLSNETGSGLAVFATSPALTTPSISGSVAMASASDLNFNAGDVTVTHSANTLTVAGGDVVVPTEVYDATGWNGDNSVPTKDAVRDKIETMGGITTATARQNTGWTSDGTTAQDTSATKYRLDKAGIQFQVVDADNDSVLVIPQSLYPVNVKDATTQLAGIDSLGRFFSALGYDAVGAAALQIGSADVTAVTVTTDGTGDGEVALPAQSISGTEMVDATVGPTQIAATAVAAGSYTFPTLTVDADGRLTAAASGVMTKAFVVESPTSSENLGGLTWPYAVTIDSVRAVLVGSASPSVTINLPHGTDRSAAGTNLFTSGQAITSVTTGSRLSTFNDATVAAAEWLWLTTSAQSGTVTWLNIVIYYRKD